MSRERLDPLLRNVWERGGSNPRAGVIVFGIFYIMILGMMFVILSVLFWATPAPGVGTLEVLVASALGALLLTAGLLVIPRRKGRTKSFPKVTGDWYVSTVELPTLEREDLLALVRSLLVRRDWRWTETHRRGSKETWIDWFDVVPIGITIRLNTIMFRRQRPFFEVNLGPETSANRGALEGLRREMSEETLRRFGSPPSKNATEPVRPEIG